MEYLIVMFAALFVAALTLFSGFGLGTLLMPVFALFFPIETAVAATAVVHGANNAFKVGFLGKSADKTMVIRFGVPAIMAAFAGAGALGYVSQFGDVVRYTVGSKVAVITPVKIVMGMLMMVFALFELLPRFRQMRFDRKRLLLGGILSGFFGGFSGHQGALRSAFLVKVGISTESFVGTNAVIGFMVDMARLTIYAVVFISVGNASPFDSGQWALILSGIIAALTGVVIGKRFIHKVTMKTIQTFTGVLLLGIALALGSGML